MKSKAAGFYSSSLEMLLDTMCNMLGGVVFIALMVAVVAQDSTVPTPEKDRAETAALVRELAAVTASNNAAEADLETLARRLQDPAIRARTNVVRLPNVENTAKKPWLVILQNGKAFPLDVFSGEDSAPVLNLSAVLYDPRSRHVEPRPGQGRDAEESVKQTVRTFQERARTNYYFAFLVHNDSFPQFVQARDAAVKLGYQYGWTPLRKNERIEFAAEGERVLPQN